MTGLAAQVRREILNAVLLQESNTGETTSGAMQIRPSQPVVALESRS